MIKKGLSENEVLELRKKFGENTLPIKEEISWLFILFSQFKNPLIYILLFAALVSLIFKAYFDVILIGLVILLDVVMGFYQEFSAKKTLRALRRFLKPKTTVIREGKRKEIEVRELVPGDLVVLDSGDQVPADGELIEGVNLLVQEAVLTGEEEAVEKSIKNDSKNLFMGTTVIAGSGIILVTKIGQETEMGKIGQSLAEIEEEETPLQLDLKKLAKNLTYIVGVICLFIFIIGIFYFKDAWQMLKLSVILSVAIIPEGLPIAITVILALGMRRILKRRGLVKKLLSIETLGTTSIICTDKTGTLTEGIMRVVKADFIDREKALFALILANNQKSNMEVSLWEYARNRDHFNAQKVFDSSERIYEETFSSEKKYMMTINRVNGKRIAFIKGAPEIVLSFCNSIPYEKEKILEKIEKWAGEGLKILGLALKREEDLKKKANYSWLGLVGIEDPIRKGAKETISVAQKAGIKIKIVTGDHLKTAERVAVNLGFNIKPENILEGKDLELISEKDLKKKIDNISLFTRVTPHQKLKIVRILQENGEVVAMTGDGINDAPALKKADIGVVMENACDVAKEAGDLILLDGKLKTIIAACEEGRLIFSNIKKVVGYVLSNSFAEITLIFSAMILGLPAPLTVVQILWIHLICDGPPDIILGFEPKESQLMLQKPRDIKKESILSGSMKFLIIAISLITGLLSLILFRYFYKEAGDLKLARTISFTTLASISLVYIFAFKNLKKLIIQTENFFKNKYLFLAIIYGFLLIFIAVYMPVLNRILGTVPLNVFHWLLVLNIALIDTFLIELVKFINGRFHSSL